MTEHTGKLLRIYLNEDQRYAGRPLHHAIVEALREAGFAGATVLKGIEGFGGRRTLHSARGADTASDLPLVIEVVDDAPKVLAFLPRLEAMIPSGLLTLENVAVTRLSRDDA